MASGEIVAPGVGQTHSRPWRSTHGNAVAQVRPDTVFTPITCMHAHVARLGHCVQPHEAWLRLTPACNSWCTQES